MPILKIRNLHIFIETQQGIDRYPFEISGGQRQRVQIVRALIVDPQCLIADEPVSDPDASMQADVINLFDQIRRDRGISIIFITHDISIVQYLADRVGVLCKGRLVELADKNEIFRNPMHAYTKSLFTSVPSLSINKSLRVLPEVGFDETEQSAFAQIAEGHFVLTSASNANTRLRNCRSRVRLYVFSFCWG